MKLNNLKRWFIGIISGVLIFSAAVSGTYRLNEKAVMSINSSPINETVFIIDAGHGGMDGGAVAKDGTVEKDINLSTAMKLRSMMNALGFKTETTRTEDIMTCNEGLSTLREKKVSDIRNRLKLLESTEKGVLISIHQNSYPSNTSKGSQVFYSGGNEQSSVLAGFIQNSLVSMIQTDNHRKIKKAGTSIYLLYHATKPAVMVECGFMTNPSECEKLKDESYQNELSFGIICGVFEYLKNLEEV